MTKQKADAIYKELRGMAPKTRTEQQLRDALEMLRKAGEVLRSVSLEAVHVRLNENGTYIATCNSCGASSVFPAEVVHRSYCVTEKARQWLAEWEGK